MFIILQLFYLQLNIGHIGQHFMFLRTIEIFCAFFLIEISFLDFILNSINLNHKTYEDKNS